MLDSPVAGKVIELAPRRRTGGRAVVCHHWHRLKRLARRFRQSVAVDIAVPVRQGVFVYDTVTGKIWQVAKTGSRFDDFLFWAYSGRTPCSGSSGHGEEGGEDDGEFVRWRSSAFVAVSGLRSAFKASVRDGVGIYLFDQENQEIATVADTRMAGQVLDPLAPEGSVVTELGLEREGLRGRWLVISAKMGITGGTEEDGMAGIYLTTIAMK